MANSCADGEDTFFRYLTWSEEDESWQMVCTDAGHCDVAPGVVYPPNIDAHPTPFKTVAVGRTLNEYHIVYITRGRGIFETEGKIYEVTPGSALLLFPGIPHRYKPDFDTGWSEYWVGFRGPYPDSLSRAGFLSPANPFHMPGFGNAILSQYQEILELVRCQEPLYQLRGTTLILGIVAEILACGRKSAQPTQAEELVARAKLLMEERIDDDINLIGIAEGVGVSPSHLSEIFKSYTSMTPHQYFISIKIARAKELLGRGLSVKEVSARIGISDEYYFSRLFKKKTGLSPSRWESRARE
ncbi:MAG: AraC family transcriptional regulator [Treponema sp.]|nr:AraC family transcriptional regulator [Treponema sp.]